MPLPRPEPGGPVLLFEADEPVDSCDVFVFDSVGCVVIAVSLASDATVELSLLAVLLESLYTVEASCVTASTCISVRSSALILSSSSRRLLPALA